MDKPSHNKNRNKTKSDQNFTSVPSQKQQTVLTQTPAVSSTNKLFFRLVFSLTACRSVNYQPTSKLSPKEIHMCDYDREKHYLHL